MKNVSLKNKIIFIVSFACVLVASISIVGFLYFNEKELEKGIISKERTIHTQLAAATQFVANQGGLDGAILKYKNKYTSADQLSDHDRFEILNQVPIYAAMVIGKQNAEIDHYKFRVFSNEPRKKENQATENEMKIFDRFQKDPQLEEIIEQENNVITLYRPVRLMKANGCLTCHGDPSTSPWKNGTDILGYKMENWSDGRLHGVFAVSQDEKEVVKAATENVILTPEGWLVGAILIGALCSILIGMIMMKGSIASLNQAANLILGVSDRVGSSSGQLASSSQNLSEAATQQASSLEQTASALEQITSMITKASESAVSAANKSAESQAKAEEGRSAVDQMMVSMDEISQSNGEILAQVNESNRQMSDIINVIQEISNKTKIIDEIVFQTKLLSFNASVEAARAGEHGKGFAVVAEEVGNLAQMSGNASKEIAEMLAASMATVHKIAEDAKAKVEALVQNGKQKVDSGVDVAHKCSEVLNDILQNISKVSGLSQEISQASKEQSQGVTEINKAMTLLDSVTQQNAATSEVAANSAQDLSGQAESLKKSVGELLKVIEGKNKAA